MDLRCGRDAFDLIVLALVEPQSGDRVVVVLAGGTEDIEMRISPAARRLNGRVERGETGVRVEEEAPPRSREDILKRDGEVEVGWHGATVVQCPLARRQALSCRP